MVTEVPRPAVSPGSRDGASVTLGGFSGCYHTALGLHSMWHVAQKGPEFRAAGECPLLLLARAPHVPGCACRRDALSAHSVSPLSAAPAQAQLLPPLLKPGMCPPAQRLVRGQSEPVSPVFRLFRAETEKLQALFPPTLFNLRTLGDQISVGVTNGSGFTAVGILRSECGGSQSPGMKYCIKNNKD